MQELLVHRKSFAGLRAVHQPLLHLTRYHNPFAGVFTSRASGNELFPLAISHSNVHVAPGPGLA